jgi:hypothetical protein
LVTMDPSSTAQRKCTYLDQGVQLHELAAKARILSACQPAAEKRRLLDSLCSNSRWTEGGLQVELRQPVDMVAAAAAADANERAAGVASSGLSEAWLPVVDVVRTLAGSSGWRTSGRCAALQVLALAV